MLEHWLLAHEPQIRLGAFALLFVLIAAWEWWLPCRRLELSRLLRWGNHLALVVLNSLLLRLLFPAAAVGMASWAQQQQLGLFNQFEMPLWLGLPVAVVLLDLAIYWQHRLFHRIPLFWRLHRVHHADPDFDLTTALRFHPLEILLSMTIKWLVVVALGPPLLAVLLFEVILNGMAMFNHANAALPGGLERRLRVLLVTPDMHRIHHSSASAEMHSNFGFNLSVWDRWFGSYVAQPQQPQHSMQIGLAAPRAPRQTCWLSGILRLPFQRL